MSYRCGMCNEPRPAGEKPRRVVTRIRRRKYVSRGGDAFGWEVEEELDMCEVCEGRTDIVEAEATTAVQGNLYRRDAPLAVPLVEGARYIQPKVSSSDLGHANVEGGLV